MADKHQQFRSEVANATVVVHNQLNRLRVLDKKFVSMDGDLRRQISLNIKSGNNAKARALACELSNIRKIQKTTQNMGLALEIVVIRFSTINEFAQILETVSPTIEMIKDIQKDISRTIPTAGQVISEMSSITSDVLVNSSIKGEVGKISTPVDSDALDILNEIEGILEDETKAKLPDVPTTIPTRTKHEQQDETEENQVMI